MKRIALYFGITVALVASCAIHEEDFKAPELDDVIFYASFEEPSEGTRVYANENLFLRWTADDRVSIFNKITYNQQYRFLGETGDNAGGFNRVDAAEFVTGNPISHVVSVYPYQEGSKISEEEVLTLTLPAEQHYAENTFGLGANTMVSVSEDNVLQFKNVGGYLRISLYGESVTVSSITLKGNNGEKLVGKATVTMPLDGVPIVSLANDAADEITLVCDTPVSLGATAEECKDFWFVVPPVTFSKGFTIICTRTHGGVFVKSTSKSITIDRSNLSKMSPIEVEGGTPKVPVPDAIDLGLPSGLKWASFNLGASKPEEYGDYYAWGETEPYYISQDPLIWKGGKELGYCWSSYTWSTWDGTITKYKGVQDNTAILDLEDDAAHVNLGGTWRMPTDVEWGELQNNCTWEWTSIDGIFGRMVTGPNGNSIFLPAAGYRGNTDLYKTGSEVRYWSSSLEKFGPDAAWFVWLDSSGVSLNAGYRYCGYPVRPVDDGIFVPVESISLNKTSLTLIEGTTETLTATVLPSNATDKTVVWSSSDTSVASVVSGGAVIAESAGTAVITVWASDGDHYATCEVTVTKREPAPVPDAIDLGLPSGLKWASFNLGASKPEQYGDYYAWGETEPKGDYSWSNYKWCMGTRTSMTKYCSNSEYGYNGFTDDKTVLDLEDDAANVNLGDKWRIPTEAEWDELITSCSWEWTSVNGVSGRKVTGPNGNSIFLPAAGRRYSTYFDCEDEYGFYWSSSLDSSPYNFHCYARYVDFYPADSGGVEKQNFDRYIGFSIRSVSE